VDGALRLTLEYLPGSGGQWWRIEASLNAFEDDDHDGEDDHGTP
jgi:hypothetical protein